MNGYQARELIEKYEDPDDIVREALMQLDPENEDIPEWLRDAVDHLDRESLSELRLSYSLCPLHGIDYAICFDDEDPECAALRVTFPNYDS